MYFLVAVKIVVRFLGLVAGQGQVHLGVGVGHQHGQDVGVYLRGGGHIGMAQRSLETRSGTTWALQRRGLIVVNANPTIIGRICPGAALEIVRMLCGPLTASGSR